MVDLDIITMVKISLHSGTFPYHLMQTDIVLIPKILNPTSTSHFRVTSICNFVYKIISKVLANRLKVHLSKLIIPFPCAFITGKQIQNNMIVSHEAFHSLRNKKQSDRETCAMKMEWVFLDAVMNRLGFHDTWIGWVRKCVS